VDGARDLAGRHVGCAALPQVAAGAILLAGAIANEAVLADIVAGLCEVAVAGAQAVAGARNFGTTGVTAPNAASLRTARYSRTARVSASGGRPSLPGPPV
jgi:MFS superfamily sulfate permease-like transporter